MHPLPSGRKGLAAFAFAWLQISGLLVVLLSLGGTLPFREALALGVPMAAFYAWDFLALSYLARALPLRSSSPLRLVATHGTASLVMASVWTAIGRGVVELLFRLGFPPAPGSAPFAPSPGEAYARAAPIVFGVGLLLTLLALALHYLVVEVEESRAARTRALELQLLTRDAELKALRSQLQPHFLYNALNSISALIRSDPKAARRTCVELGDLLRRSLALGARERIPLGQELELSESLLEIEKVRFGERLAVRWSVEEAARSQPVPSLLLQPLVENAVTHGIAGLLDGGSVSIEARLAAGRLLLAVENPTDPEAEPKRGSGIGLENVRRRLHALYGREASFRIITAAGLFRVELALPVEDLEGAPDAPGSGSAEAAEGLAHGAPRAG